MLDVMSATVGLGLFKNILNFFTSPKLTSPVNSIANYCNILVVFTDFTMTGFLTLFWLFSPFLSSIPTRSDIIALRFLSFLSHTYGTLLLLAVPLIVTETLCRLIWPLPHPQVRNEKEREKPSAKEVEEESNSGGQTCCSFLLQVPSSLSALLSWVIAASYSNRFILAEVDRIEHCFLLSPGGGSITNCIPDFSSTFWPHDYQLLLTTLLLCGTFLLLHASFQQYGTCSRPHEGERSNETASQLNPKHREEEEWAQGSATWEIEEWTATHIDDLMKATVCGVTLYLFLPVLAVNTSLFRCLEDFCSWFLPCIVGKVRFLRNSDQSKYIWTTFGAGSAGIYV
ncbi:uncharacterized protein LOC121305300 [Polyodon spathula]|uniref:uncharacterized protein LOC121305300 n=1 Tax=Polyodon spathula TaxID=7913 RepID=UPI001B7DDB76|nr:uncharacterized protein LOC121305300 [Polyodon spathula]